MLHGRAEMRLSGDDSKHEFKSSANASIFAGGTYEPL
jgi:hypothetical protein